MAKVCILTGKKSRKTVDRSKSMHASIRRRKANLQKKRIQLPNGQTVKVWMSARAIRTLKKKNVKSLIF